MTSVGGGTRTGAADEGIMLTTKGDIHSFDNEDKRLPVGVDGQILTADSLQALGVKWAAPAVGFNLTTKGDIHTFDVDQNRLPVGSDGQVLTANSAVGLGIEWAAPAAAGATTELDNLGTTAVNAAINMDAGTQITFTNANISIQASGVDSLELDVPTGGAFILRINNALQYRFDATRLDLKTNNLNLDNNQFIQWGLDATRRIKNDGLGFEFEVPAGDTFEFFINSVSELILTLDELQLQGNTLRLGGTGTSIIFDDNNHSILQAASDLRYNTVVNQGHGFFVDSVVQMRMDATALTLSAGNNLVIQGSGATGFIELQEITVPANPSANSGLLYLKDVAAVTTLFFRDSAGTETNLLAGGGAGATTELDNLGTTAVNAAINMGVNALTFGDANTSITGVTNDLEYDVDFGNSHRLRINNVSIMEVSVSRVDLPDGYEIRWGGSADRRIINTSAQTIFEVEAGDNFEWQIAGVQMRLTSTLFELNNQAITAVGSIAFLTADESIRAVAAGMQYDAATGDSHEFRINDATVLDINESVFTLSQITILDFITNTGLRWGGDSNRLISNNLNGFFFKVPTADTFRFQVQAADATVISAASLTLRSGQNLVVEASGATGFIDLGEITVPANPAANIGRLYVKDVAAVTTLFFRDNAGTETDLLAGGGEVFTWTNNHDANANDLLNAGDIQFNLALSALPGAAIPYIMFGTTLGMVFNVPTNDVYSFRVNQVEWLNVVEQNEDFTLINMDINMSSGNVIQWGGQPQRSIVNDTGGFTFNVQAADTIEFVQGGAQIFRVTTAGDFNLNTGVNLETTGAGSIIASLSTQQLAFWGSTPVSQQSVGSDTLANLYTLLRAIGIVA